MNAHASAGLSLIELLVALAIVAILTAIAYPSYRDYVIRSSRTAAQNELVELSSIQEKIYLNSNAYSSSITAAYTGTAAGGLGKTSGTSDDGKYTLTVASPGQSYTISATPVAGSTQQNDGAFSISSNGTRSCTPTPKWCQNSTW